MIKDELWKRYQKYLEEGDLAIPPKDWPAACMSWEAWKDFYGLAHAGEEANENCLKGIKCPHCGQHEQFYILSTVTAVVTDDGAEAKDGNFGWDDKSGIHCPDCYADGTVGDFKARAGGMGNPPQLEIRRERLFQLLIESQGLPEYMRDYTVEQMLKNRIIKIDDQITQERAA